MFRITVIWRILCLVFFLVLVGGAIWWYSSTRRTPLIAPLSQLSYLQLRDTEVAAGEKRVMGYLPYWTLGTATPSASVTDLAYFSVTLQSNGQIQEREGNELDMGLRRLQSQAFTDLAASMHEQGKRVHIVVTVMDNDDIFVLLQNESSRRQAIETITQVVASYPFDGVNIDIEYTGEVSDGLRANYALFLAELNDALDAQNSSLELSAAVFGSAASKYMIWDIKAMAPHLDFLVVMSYDYHVRSSAVAGPVAPIFGKGTGRWQDDVVSNMRDLLLQIESHKVYLGVPFYGYEWTTTSDKPGSTTFPKSGSTATYERVSNILQDPDLEAKERWDEDALSPYIVYEQDGDTQLIYYENSRSLSYKLDFVKQTNLAGIAIWALGYEGPHPELWNVIGQKLGQISP